MDGNRGAKGSIKDRLISMLYRIRYAKKVKKEEEYQVAKKEKQVEYLQTLLNLKEQENIDILDSSDKHQLENIKFNVNYKLTDSGFKVSKKGIGVNEGLEVVDLNLMDIEQKTNELDVKVNLKDEIKKTKNEIVILAEVNKFVKESKENLDEINEEVEVLQSLSKEKNQDTKSLEERYKKLREKVDKLKAQYDAIKEKYDLSEFSILESIKLIDNITDYKSRANLNEMDMMIKVCKKEINKIESVTIEYEQTKKVGSNIDGIKKEQTKIKVIFHKNKEDINKISNIEIDLNDTLKKQEQVIDEMYREASYFEKIVKTELKPVKVGNMLSSLVRIACGILTLPFTGAQIFGVALGNTMINRGLKSINNNLNRERKIVYEYKYTDIAHKISEVKDRVEYTNLIISDNLNEIKLLKANFKRFKEYNKVLPEYESMLNKVNKLEQKLKLQQEKILKMDKKLGEEKILNDKKMKKIERYNDRNK